MNLFRKLFGALSEEENSDNKQNVKSPYSSEEILPIDELFTFNFKANGGKFIYCENLDEISENFENILAENDWFECNSQCFDNRLLYLLNENKITYHSDSEPVFFYHLAKI